MLHVNDVLQCDCLHTVESLEAVRKKCTPDGRGAEAGATSDSSIGRFEDSRVFEVSLQIRGARNLM